MPIKFNGKINCHQIHRPGLSFPLYDQVTATVPLVVIITACVIVVTLEMDSFVQVCAKFDTIMHIVLVFLQILLTDDNECKNGLHDCDINANCTNTIGSFECTCKDGFLGDGKTCISKINEYQ